jgi:hypothetical protein
MGITEVSLKEKFSEVCTCTCTCMSSLGEIISVIRINYCQLSGSLLDFLSVSLLFFHFSFCLSLSLPHSVPVWNHI